MSGGAKGVRGGATTHGDTGSKEWRTWAEMKRHCRPYALVRRYYYDRGIKVCDEWKDSYPAFLAHVGRAPTPKHTLDRIDGMLGYEPGNVRWATMKEQRANRRPDAKVSRPWLGWKRPSLTATKEELRAHSG